MNSICTKIHLKTEPQPLGSDCFSAVTTGRSLTVAARMCYQRRRRGTAEIETLLVIPVLLAILFLAGGLAKLGAERLSNVWAAEKNPYTQTVQSNTLTSSSNLVPVDGIGAVRPGLPNWYTGAPESRDVAIPFGRSTSLTKTIVDQTAFLDTSWRITDHLEGWFEDYVAEDHPADLVTSLGLAPAWMP